MKILLFIVAALIVGCSHLHRPFVNDVPVQIVYIGPDSLNEKLYLQNSKSVFRSDLNIGLASYSSDYEQRLAETKWSDRFSELSKFMTIFSAIYGLSLINDRDRPMGNFDAPLAWLGGAFVFSLSFDYFRKSGDKIRDEVISDYNKRIKINHN